MKFTEVMDVPRKRAYNSLHTEWENFIAMNIKTVKVDLSDRHYANSTVAYGVMKTSIKRFGYPIKVKRRGNEIYLIRTDM